VFIKTQKSNKLFTVLTNPVLDNLRIVVSSNEQIQLVLINSIGQQVYSKQISASAGMVLSIPVQQLAKGMYSLKVISGRLHQTESVLVQ
jgi:hypothetical protein